MVDRRCSLLTALWFAGGLAIAGLGFALSARAGTESFLDPIPTGRPVVFADAALLLPENPKLPDACPDTGGQ